MRMAMGVLLAGLVGVSLTGRACLAASPADQQGVSWLAMGEQMAAESAGAPATQPATGPAAQAGGPFVPWRQRIGPAYPSDLWHSFGRDLKELPATAWDDTKVSFTNPVSVIGILLAGAAGISLASTGVDDHVADHVTRHGSQLNTFWDSVGDAGGNPSTHFALAGASYLFSLWRGDTKTYEVSKTMLNALSITGVFTVALKGIVRTESPNGDEYGWPSGHASSSFAVATVLAESYGPWVGVPAFAFAGFVGYERIDARNHDFSDVISGALIGMAIGHAVTQNHMPRILGMDVVPYATGDEFGVTLYARK